MITLMKHFKSVKKIAKCRRKAISEVVGVSKAKKFPTFTRQFNLK